jgi:polyketide synthase PksJ
MAFDNKADQKEVCATDIAVVGMSGRFPGAENIEIFWNNLVQGVETIQQFTEEELRLAGESAALLRNPDYVRAKGILKDIDLFDANFFGYSAYDAKLTDPQHRLFLACAWEALESAGYVPEKYSGLIAVYASMADSLYLQKNLLKNKAVLHSCDRLQTRIATSIGFLSTQLSYRLNLKGPSVNIATGCSSALVAIATACKGLVDYDCDIAIAGAVAISVPQKRGYLFQQGGIDSPDGHCRAFDEDAQGTVFSNGLGVVILKRLQDAIADGDSIHAIVKGWHVNNDGASKVGFSAPSVEGQARCVASALALADIDAESLSYVEAHGTGTALGDPIEMSALTEAFRIKTDKKAFCALGSVKTNIGHIDIAAGMAGFMKVVMALKHKIIPATLHYRQANTKIDFPNTPFYVNAQTRDWKDENVPRRAGVNASGVGGTNAFLVLEEYVPPPQHVQKQSPQLFLLSAKTKNALEKTTQNLRQHLEKNQQADLPHIAFTLQQGRADFNHRRMFVCQDMPDALFLLSHLPPDGCFTKQHTADVLPKVVFMFPGQGSQYMGMAKKMYDAEPVFAQWVDHCCDYLDIQTKKSIHSLLFSTFPKNITEQDTRIVQPALFIVEYALAQLWMHVGIQPDAMIGHSLGEYVAACLSGVFTLENALALVCHRARCISKTNPGVMLAIEMDKQRLLDFLDKENVCIAAVNTRTSCVVSGEPDAISAVEEKCKQAEVMTRRLKTAHAFHSSCMDPILEDFKSIFSDMHLSAPNIPFVSNITGRWIKKEEAIDPDYWAKHIRHPVLFLQGLQMLAQDNCNIYLEIGPGKTLTHFANQSLKKNTDILVQNSLPVARDETLTHACFLSAVGQLWLHGAKIDWVHFYTHKKRNRLPLPTYPFERQSYWIFPDTAEKEARSEKKLPYPQWFYEHSWIRHAGQHSHTMSPSVFSTPHCWVILSDHSKIQDTLCAILEQHNQLFIRVNTGDHFVQSSRHHYLMHIAHKPDYQDLVQCLMQVTDLPLCILNLLPITPEHNLADLDLPEVHKTVDRCFYSALFFTQALIEQHYDKPVHMMLVANEMHAVIGNENIYPAKASAIGPCRVIAQEHPAFKMRIVDVIFSEIMEDNTRHRVCYQLIADTIGMQQNGRENIIAYRSDFRWTQVFRPLEIMPHAALKLDAKGVYVFTGGLGGISLTLAKHIARASKKPRLILMSRSDFPEQAAWEEWLLHHPVTDAISKKIIHLQAIQNLGADIVILQVDIAQFDQVYVAIDQIKKKFGAISGVVHAAGVAGGGLSQLKTAEMANKIFAPKIDGTYILMHLLREEPLKFFMLCSSISALFGELSQIDYCAANACLDAFPYMNLFTHPVSCISVNWNTWREIGMAVETQKPVNMTYFDRNNDISPEEGATIFSDVLHNGYKHNMISTMDINTFIDLASNKNMTVAAAATLAERQDILGEDEHYVPPTSTVENDLVVIWQDIFGIDKIGITDDFFRLGGHSLMALRLLAIIGKKFDVIVHFKKLQEAKNIKNLATSIEEMHTHKRSHSASIISPLRLGEKERSLFFFHPVGGTFFCYMHLAKQLAFDGAIYGIQDPSIARGKFMYRSLEEMAPSYRAAIQTIQPHGPYLLAGLSFGATLSVEVARQLQEKKEDVKPLIFFDGWAKFSNAQHIKKLFYTGITHMYGKDIDSAMLSELAWERMRLLLNYKIPTIENDIFLFKAKDLLPEYTEIDHTSNYWDSHTRGNITVHLVSGNHETILDMPHVQGLSEQLNDILIKIAD